MPAAPAPRPPRLLAFLRHEPLVGEGAGQQQQAEGDEGERPGELFQLGEVVGPDLGDRERQQRQAAEADFRRAPHHAPDDRAEPGGRPEGREPGLADLAGFAAVVGADHVDDRDRAEVDEPGGADEARHGGGLRLDLTTPVPAGERGARAAGDRDQASCRGRRPLRRSRPAAPRRPARARSRGRGTRRRRAAVAPRPRAPAPDVRSTRVAMIGERRGHRRPGGDQRGAVEGVGQPEAAERRSRRRSAASRFRGGCRSGSRRRRAGGGRRRSRRSRRPGRAPSRRR